MSKRFIPVVMLVGLTTVAGAQEAISFADLPPDANAPADHPYAGGLGLEPESLPGEMAEDFSTGTGELLRFGPTPVSEVGILRRLLGLAPPCVLDPAGNTFLPLHFHFRGEGRFPVRDLAHVRPTAEREARAALRAFVVRKLKESRPLA